jgi:hypothetical protein
VEAAARMESTHTIFFMSVPPTKAAGLPRAAETAQSSPSCS